jgi:hypothetical protein
MFREGNEIKLSLASRLNTSSIGAADIIALGFNPGIKWYRVNKSPIGTADKFS